MPDTSLAKLIDELAHLWDHGSKMTVAKRAWYESSWQDIPRDDLKAAIRIWNSTGKFMPRPADILELCGASPETFDAAGLAWKVVRDAIRRVGGYESVLFADPAITSAVEDLGGWVYLATMTSRDLDFAAKNFPKAYELARRIKKLAPKVLPGIFSRDGGESADRVQTKRIGFINGELRIEAYRPAHDEQKLLGFSKPVKPERMIEAIKMLADKTKAVAMQESPDVIPARAHKPADPMLAKVEAQLMSNKKLRALAREVRSEMQNKG